MRGRWSMRMILRRRDDGGQAFNRFAAVPGHDEIMATAPAAIYSCLARDTSTGVAIDDELAQVGTTVQEIASTFAVMAAARRAEACGGTAEARRLAARWTRRITAHGVRAVIAAPPAQADLHLDLCLF